MSKNRNKHSKKGFKRNSIRPLLIQVFERNQGEQLTHKELCQVIDARDPNSRQNVFDELSMLVKHGSIERVNHFTFSISWVYNFTIYFNDGTSSIKVFIF